MEFDWYLLLCIEDVFYVVKIIVYMLMFDFYFGYFQVSVVEEDCDKIVFVMFFGIYRFKRMFMGLCNFGVMFQRLIDWFWLNLVVLVWIFEISDGVVMFLDF